MSNENDGWMPVADEDVNLEWECSECSKTVHVEPTYFQENGEPVCGDCDIDMVYVRTIVRLPTK